MVYYSQTSIFLPKKSLPLNQMHVGDCNVNKFFNKGVYVIT